MARHEDVDITVEGALYSASYTLL